MTQIEIINGKEYKTIADGRKFPVNKEYKLSTDGLSKRTGRPSLLMKKYRTGKNLTKKGQEIIERYKEEGKYLTVSRLFLELGATRGTMLNYLKRYNDNLEQELKQDKFLKAIDSLLMHCEAISEEYMFSGKNTGGVALLMKNRFGWVDKVESTTTLKGGINLTTILNNLNESDRQRLEESKDNK